MLFEVAKTAATLSSYRLTGALVSVSVFCLTDTESLHQPILTPSSSLPEGCFAASIDFSRA